MYGDDLQPTARPSSNLSIWLEFLKCNEGIVHDDLEVLSHQLPYSSNALAMCILVGLSTREPEVLSFFIDTEVIRSDEDSTRAVMRKITR
jgi:hypothetical protein